MYGVQWHPEKAPYEWGTLKGISHAPNAVKAAFYLAEFFVSEGNFITLLSQQCGFEADCPCLNFRVLFLLYKCSVDLI